MNYFSKIYIQKYMIFIIDNWLILFLFKTEFIQ